MEKSYAVLMFILLHLTLHTSAQKNCDGESCYRGETAAESNDFFLVPGKPSHTWTNTTARSYPLLRSISCGKLTCPGDGESITCCPGDNCCEQKNGKCCDDPKYCCQAGHICCGDYTWCCPESKNCSSVYGKCLDRKGGNGSCVNTVAFFFKLLPFILLMVFIS